MTPLLPTTAAVPVFAPLVGRKVGLIFYEGCGNAGDRLIEAATEQLLRRFRIDYQIVRPDEPGDSQVLLLSGGGNYGHTNCYLEAETRKDALATCLPCVLLPQTAYGSESNGISYEAAFVRDVTSMSHVPNAVLAPDLAFCYQSTMVLLNPVHAVGKFFVAADEGLFKGVGTDPRYDFTDGQSYLEFVAAHKEIHTDSLHVAVCGLIAGRDVTLYPTMLHKQESVYAAWLRWMGCRWGVTPP